jgi:hypothetical protein
VIPRVARWGWWQVSRRQEKETSDSEQRGVHRGGHIVGKRKKRAIQCDAVGIAAGTPSASERNERFHERRCGDGSGHVIGK